MISVTILTQNSARHLNRVLQALSSFKEVLIYDNGSTDETLDIARRFPNVKIEKGPFLGFGETHNLASGLAKHDWILSIDSDEVATAALVNEIRQLQLDLQTVYSFPRHNFYRGKWIRWCGWYPDRVIRLYNRRNTRFTDAKVHEGVKTEGMQVAPLQSSVKHYPYETVHDFLTKMQTYSSLFAAQNRGKKRSSPWKALVHGAAAFWKSYLIKRGFLGGYEGFLISAYNGHTAFYKYLKLYEENRISLVSNEP